MAKLYIKMDKLNHGEIVLGRVGRYCKVHKVIHGLYFECPCYPDDVLKQIKKESKRKCNMIYGTVFIWVALIMMLILFKVR